MSDMVTNTVPPKIYMLHTAKGNEFFLDRMDAIYEKDDLDRGFAAEGFSKRTPIYEITLGYEIDPYNDGSEI